MSISHSLRQTSQPKAAFQTASSTCRSSTVPGRPAPAWGSQKNVWYDDMPWVEQKAQQMYSEVVGILGSISLKPDGKLTREPYKEKPIATVRLKSSKKGKLKKGEIVDVRAIVENAEAEDGRPVYTWSGDHAGTGEKVQFLASTGASRRSPCRSRVPAGAWAARLSSSRWMRV